MYYAKTNSIQYNVMVISKTKKGAYKALKNYWENDYPWREETPYPKFEDAMESYGFWVDSEPIKLNQAFDI